MFYNFKLLFFIIVYCISLILCYFIDKQLVLPGNLQNPFILALVIFCAVILLSVIIVFLLHFVFKKIINLFLKLFKKDEINNNGFLVWLNFTLISYILLFIIFAYSIQY